MKKNIDTCTHIYIYIKCNSTIEVNLHFPLKPVRWINRGKKEPDSESVKMTPYNNI